MKASLVNAVSLISSKALVLCPSLPTFVNADITDYNTRVHSVVTIASRAGYKFTEGGTIRSVICLENGRWNSLVAECTGRNFFDI